VWSWDNCFNCLALAQAYPGIAIDQMMIPFDWITPEGRLPDSMAHSEILYDYTKPPIYGWTTFKLLDFLASGKHSNILDAVSNERLTELYDKISKNTMFWYDCRKAKGLRIPWYTHGNDSGWDNATCYDRQTIAASPDSAAFLIVQNDFLAQTAHHLGNAEAEEDWKAKRDDMVEALLELWDDDNKVFQFQDAYDLSKWSTPTLLKYIPLVASAHLPKKVVESMTTGLRAHLTEWGLATEDPNSKDYESDGYWRGPIWAPPTILIESGLRVAGNIEFADEISGRYQRLCEKSGFAENYNAITGEGNRDLSYTWSASTYLVLRREQEEREAKST
jgi:glycogen debranching enzyme